MTDLPTVRLRGHHLLCMLTWVGVGYTKAFSEKYDQCVDAIKAGAEIEVVQGPDDLCDTLDPVTFPDYHCFHENQIVMDGQALAAINERLGLSLRVGARFTANGDLIASMRAHYKTGDIRPACQLCPWRDFCTEIARDGFIDTRL